MVLTFLVAGIVMLSIHRQDTTSSSNTTLNFEDLRMSGYILTLGSGIATFAVVAWIAVCLRQVYQTRKKAKELTELIN